MYNILFEAAKETLFAFAADKKHLGASMGFIALLHTWGQNLSLHPHLHCIVPGGGITTAGQWKTTRSKGDFLFPIKLCKQLLKFDVDECPVCKKGRMITLLNFSANAPPSMEIIKEIKRQIVHK
jgi:hypothetical protein